MQRIVAEHVDSAIATLSPAEEVVAAKVLRQLVTPSGTKIALHVVGPRRDRRARRALRERRARALTREGRILQATGNGRYEIYHDALARPILDWRRRWQAEQDRAGQRRRIRIVAGIAGALLLTAIVMVVLAWTAIEGHREADRRTVQARSVGLAFASGDQVAAQPDVALLLALAALEQKDLPEARNSMMAAREAASPGDAIGIMRGHADDVNGVAFVRGGRAIASTADVGQPLLWDPATRRRTSTLRSAARALLTSLAATRDGGTLAAGTAGGPIELFDVAAGTSRQLTGTTRRVDALAFSPDGQLLASAGEEHVIRLWDVRSGLQLRPPIRIGDRRTLDLAFSPDGDTLASADTIYAVRLWSVRSRRQRGNTFERGRRPLTSVAFAPDGSTLAIGGAETWLWSPASDRRRRLASTGGQVNDVAFSPDGARLGAAGNDGTVRLWDVRSGRPQGPPIAGPTARVATVAFSPDGRTIAAGGADRKVWLFDAVTPRALDRHEDAVDDVAFDATGAVLATAGADAKVFMWNVRSRLAPGPPIEGASGFSKIALGRDGRTLATTTRTASRVRRGAPLATRKRGCCPRREPSSTASRSARTGARSPSGGDEEPGGRPARHRGVDPRVRARFGEHSGQRVRRGLQRRWPHARVGRRRRPDPALGRHKRARARWPRWRAATTGLVNDLAFSSDGRSARVRRDRRADLAVGRRGAAADRCTRRRVAGRC